MNRVSLVGNITRTPELKQTPSGVAVCTFSVACQRRFKNAAGEYEADFINCVAWRTTAEFIGKYFSKGMKIGVTGSIQTRSYDDKEGVKRYATEVVVDEAEFVTPKGADAAPRTEPKPQPDSQFEDFEMSEQDLPF